MPGLFSKNVPESLYRVYGCYTSLGYLMCRQFWRLF